MNAQSSEPAIDPLIAVRESAEALRNAPGARRRVIVVPTGDSWQAAEMVEAPKPLGGSTLRVTYRDARRWPDEETAKHEFRSTLAAHDERLASEQRANVRQPPCSDERS
ncbi:MAG: hypothetical protein AAF961_05240 [Planctomycetota bacterium]